MKLRNQMMDGNVSKLSLLQPQYVHFFLCFIQIKFNKWVIILYVSTLMALVQSQKL